MDQRHRRRMLSDLAGGPVFSRRSIWLAVTVAHVQLGCTLSSYLEYVVDSQDLDRGIIKTHTREQNAQLPDLECTL
jgi:hypothetical protein